MITVETAYGTGEVEAVGPDETTLLDIINKLSFYDHDDIVEARELITKVLGNWVAMNYMRRVSDLRSSLKHGESTPL